MYSTKSHLITWTICLQPAVKKMNSWLTISVSYHKVPSWQFPRDFRIEKKAIWLFVETRSALTKASFISPHNKQVLVRTIRSVHAATYNLTLIKAYLLCTDNVYTISFYFCSIHIGGHSGVDGHFYLAQQFVIKPCRLSQTCPLRNKSCLRLVNFYYSLAPGSEDGGASSPHLGYGYATDGTMVVATNNLDLRRCKLQVKECRLIAWSRARICIM